MNPKISVAVDLKNKAVSTVSGMLTVGADVDVEVRGLPSDIPNWGDGDVFSGLSLRFRIVDEHGRDLARYPLKDSDTWSRDNEGVCRTDGALLMDTAELRKCFCGVPFDGVQDLCVIIDSVVDKAQYAIGRIKVKQWRVASSEDPTVLPDWRDTLEQLNERLSEVGASKNAAEAAAKRAEDEAGKSADSARDAANKAQETHEMRNDAIVAKNAAVGAKTAAEVAIARYPKIGANGNWWVWDVATGVFVDTGFAAKGEKGDMPSLEGVVKKDEVVAETIADGVKIATIGGKEIKAPKGGGGGSEATSLELRHEVVSGKDKYSILKDGVAQSYDDIYSALVRGQVVIEARGVDVNGGEDTILRYMCASRIDDNYEWYGKVLKFVPVVTFVDGYFNFRKIVITKEYEDSETEVALDDLGLGGDFLWISNGSNIKGLAVYKPSDEDKDKTYEYEGNSYPYMQMAIEGDAVYLYTKNESGGVVMGDPIPLRALLYKLSKLNLSIDGTTIESTQAGSVATLAFNVDSDVFAYDDFVEVAPAMALELADGSGDSSQATQKPRLRFKLKGEIEQIKAIIDTLGDIYAKKSDVPAVVAPASDTALSGKAADAYETGKKLAGKRDKTDLSVDYWYSETVGKLPKVISEGIVSNIWENDNAELKYVRGEFVGWVFTDKERGVSFQKGASISAKHIDFKNDQGDVVLSMDRNSDTLALTSEVSTALGNKLDKSDVSAPSSYADYKNGKAADEGYVEKALGEKVGFVNSKVDGTYGVQLSRGFTLETGNIYGDCVFIRDKNGVFLWFPGERTDIAAKEGEKVLALISDIATHEAGGLTPSAKAALFADTAFSAACAYKLVMVGADCVLTDRAINQTSAANVSLPTEYTDLVIRATVTGSLNVTVGDGVVKYGDSFPAEDGEFLVTITKTGAAEIYVRTLKIEEVA